MPMHPVGFPSIAWMPPYAAHVPAATTAQALGARRSIHSHVVIGCPFLFVPKLAQYPSDLLCSLGIGPSITKRKGQSNFPSAARWKNSIKSSPTSYARNGLWKFTLGMPGNAPSTISSMLGCVAAVMAIVSPSQPSPAVIQRTCSSVIDLDDSEVMIWRSVLTPVAHYCRDSTKDCPCGRRAMSDETDKTVLVLGEATAFKSRIIYLYRDARVLQNPHRGG